MRSTNDAYYYYYYYCARLACSTSSSVSPWSLRYICVQGPEDGMDEDKDQAEHQHQQY